MTTLPIIKRMKRLIIHTLIALRKKIMRYRNFYGSYNLRNRATGSQHLLIVVAGYFPEFWSVSLGRIRKFQPKELDVCIVSAGVYSQKLDVLCEQNNWSYLFTKINKLALAQNIAIELHPNAEWIFKLDEDIVIGEGYFNGLLDAWEHEHQRNRYKNIGFVAPTLNINGASYIPFLHSVNADKEYMEYFGELVSACSEIKAHYSGEAARFIWEKTSGFDAIVSKYRKKEIDCSVIPHRFSIGALLLRREFWQSFGGFRVSILPKVLGLEEKQLCMDCVDLSYVMLLANNVFAGHFAFGPQRPEMVKHLDKLLSELSVS